MRSLLVSLSMTVVMLAGCGLNPQPEPPGGGPSQGAAGQAGASATSTSGGGQGGSQSVDANMPGGAGGSPIFAGGSGAVPGGAPGAGGKAGAGGDAWAGAGGDGKGVGGGGAGGDAAAAGGSPTESGGAGGQGGAPSPDACGACEGFGDVAPAVPVGEAALLELSGLAASKLYPDILYAHNDSGDKARFFAFTSAGAAVAEIDLEGAKARDIEDMGVGPCAAGSCVYLGDFGDNDEVRDDCSIVRLAEPQLPPSSAKLTATFERLPFRYPDKAHNAESLLVDPKGEHLYVITKSFTGKSEVFRLSATAAAGELQTAEHITTIALPKEGGPLATGGSAHPCAPRFLLRTYTRLWQFSAPPGGTLEDAFSVEPLAVPVAKEEQGEAVTYTQQGLGYVTASEGAPALSFVGCGM